MRKIILWNDNWTFYKEDTASPVALPHTWNAEDGQDGGNDYYRGTCRYEKRFSRPELNEGEELWIEFRGAAMTAEVFLNGRLLSRHEGGYSTFRVNLTEGLQEENLLQVSVDNSANRRVYPQKADFTFYGGIYRDVYLLIVPKEHFALDYYGGSGMKVTPLVSDDLKTAHITVETWHNGSRVEITVDGVTKRCGRSADSEAQQREGSVGGEPGRCARGADGVTEQRGIDAGFVTKQSASRAEFTIENPHLWDGKADPYLYEARATLPGGDSVSVRFGIRKIAFDPEQGFLLNNRPLRLCGAARHQDREGLGNALTKREHEEDLALLLEMGANTVRLAHYQHDQYFYDLCDEKGLIVWAEIPYITEHMPEARENTLSQMTELIVQNYHHPGIVCWGLSNEITATGGVTEDLIENHRQLDDLCHRLDATRPTTMAYVFMLSPNDPFVMLPDIRSYNLYYGWYVGEAEQNDQWFDDFHRAHPDAVIGLSEYGADANPRYQSARPEKGDWTESYQALYHEHMLKMWSERPYIWAMHCWNGFDFGADGRDEGGKPGQNQKGLVTFDRKIRKDAFFLYKAYLSDEPFVHLCGRRYADRTERETEIKVYSNQRAVTLFVDGKEVGTQEGDKIFRFQIPISGEHEIKAVAGRRSDSIGSGIAIQDAMVNNTKVNVAMAGDAVAKKGMVCDGMVYDTTVCDTMTIRHASTSNRDYVKDGGGIVNWFDREDEILREGYFSIKDSMGEIKANPAAQAVMDEMVAPLQAKIVEAYGDVAKNVQIPPEMAAMMEKMSVEQSLKQMAKLVTPEFVHRLNHALNQVKKQERV
ncbi:MAG: glycoside hydrolase family 2 protein [Roseburia sp.]|nr:glycoside hydrolase family 2 protein [Roseburia sp.]MCM1099394.1 glycoside hydrolase family 2 protein [Ruminococcus flavefaciens]